jgi:hypothetical protein
MVTPQRSLDFSDVYKGQFSEIFLSETWVDILPA